MTADNILKIGDTIKIVWSGEICDARVVSVPSGGISLFKDVFLGKYCRYVKIELPDGKVITCKTFSLFT